MVSILYISFHAGTHINFDAIAEECEWNVTHLMPPHGYQLNREIAHKVWINSYASIIENCDFTHIVISDTMICTYPFFMAWHSCEKLKNIRFILHITNYFDHENNHNVQYHNDFREFVTYDNVKVIYVDLFIKEYLRCHHIYPKHVRYIPLTGHVGVRSHETITPPVIHDRIIGDIYFPKAAPIVSSATFCIINKRPISAAISELLRNYNVHVEVIPEFYGGMQALSNFLGVVYIPYHYSTMSFREFFSQGLIVLIPSKTFCKSFTHDEFHVDLCDYYVGPLSDLAVTFDSFEELIGRIRLFESNLEYAHHLKNKIVHEVTRYDHHIVQTQWKDYVCQ